MSVRLTQTVKKGGCAAKIAATTLREILSSIELPNKHPDLLTAGDSFDDAAVYKISDELACVETLDFFTPIVDTPYLFGRIAAVNALSDVYAMGGLPRTCLAILAFPLAVLDQEIMADILAGACAAVRDAEALLVGGHSIDDESIKFGLSVSGHVHPKRIWDNQSARPGDDLVLTKALGTGTLCAGLKRGVYREADIQDALDSMSTLNDIARCSDPAVLSGVHGATDVTGFGLLGHGMQLAQASNCSLEIDWTSLPTFKQVSSSLAAGHLTKAHRSNLNYTEPFVQVAPAVDETEGKILYDPQTSGGLLLSVDPACTQRLLDGLQEAFPCSRKIGKVGPARESAVYVG